MNRIKTLALVCLIFTSVFAGVAADPVFAQEDPTPEGGTETPTDTPEEDESDDEEDDSGDSNESDSEADESDGGNYPDGPPDNADENDDSEEEDNSDEEDGENITIDFGDVSEVDSSPEEVEATKIDQDMGGGVHIYDVQWDEDNEEVTFKLRTPRSLDLAVTDSKSIDPDSSGGNFAYSTLSVSRGTYEVTFPATVRGDSQLITITGAPDPTYLQSPDDSSSIVPQSGPDYVAFTGGIGSGTGVLLLLVWQMNKRDRNKRIRVL